jgi:hypothetical protein
MTGTGTAGRNAYAARVSILGDPPVEPGYGPHAIRVGERPNVSVYPDASDRH